MMRIQKSTHDPILYFVQRMPVRLLKRTAVRMEIIIKDGWGKRHLVRAVYERVRSDDSPNQLMAYLLFK